MLEPRGNVGRDLKAACKRAGIDPVTPNDLRRTFASWLKQAGINSLTVAHLLGHTTTRMVELVYGRLSPDTNRSAIDALPDCAVSVSSPDPRRPLRAGKSRTKSSNNRRKRAKPKKHGADDQI